MIGYVKKNILATIAIVCMYLSIEVILAIEF